MGEFKKFCLNLTTVALPNLVAHDLVIVHPMSSFSGYVAYIKYTAGSNKGQTKQGDVFNSPFGLGKVDANYTGDRVVETVAKAGAQGSFVPAWTPVIKAFDNGTKELLVTPAAGGAAETKTIAEYTPAQGDKVAYVYDNVVIPQNDLPIYNAEMASIPLVAKARRIAVKIVAA